MTPEKFRFCPILILALCLPSCAPAQSKSDWPMFGHDPESTRFSPLNQINPKNVSTLTRAWTYHLKKNPTASIRTSQATPIVTTT